MAKKYIPLDLAQVKTCPLGQRQNKVMRESLATPLRVGASFRDFADSWPHILAARDIKAISLAVAEAYRGGKPVIVSLGGHVVKCGLSPVLIQLMERGIVTALATNGAGLIHDVELALQGKTSEDVVAGLKTGMFGMARETGECINKALAEMVSPTTGIGEAVGRHLIETQAPFRQYSLLARGAELGLPTTVHVALGTDIVHTHPGTDGAKWGEGSMVDFRLLASVIADLGQGGVLLNFGSAVIMPEVILKAVNVVRNLGYNITGFVSANFDFIRQYRSQNILERMEAIGARPYSITGHHELMLPLLCQLILEELG